MPEASVYFDNCLVPGQHKIRATRKALNVESKSQARTVQIAADETFRNGVLAADSRHHPASGGAVDDISHRRTA